MGGVDFASNKDAAFYKRLEVMVEALRRENDLNFGEFLVEVAYGDVAELLGSKFDSFPPSLLWDELSAHGVDVPKNSHLFVQGFPEFIVVLAFDEVGFKRHRHLVEVPEYGALVVEEAIPVVESRGRENIWSEPSSARADLAQNEPLFSELLGPRHVLFPRSQDQHFLKVVFVDEGE